MMLLKGVQIKNRSPIESGFTLIELMVVLVLISITLFFAIPKISNNVFEEGKKKTTRWLLLTIKQLKAKSVYEGKTYTLHCSMDADKFWITDESAGSEEEQEPKPEKGFELPEGVQLLDVQFFSMDAAAQGEVGINFYSKGYSDRAIIHLGYGEDKRLSLIVEPFLPNAEWFENYISFEEVRYETIL